VHRLEIKVLDPRIQLRKSLRRTAEGLHGTESLPERLTVSQVVKNFLTFSGDEKLIIAFTTVRHLSLSSARSIQSMPPPTPNLFLEDPFNPPMYAKRRREEWENGKGIRYQLPGPGGLEGSPRHRQVAYVFVYFYLSINFLSIVQITPFRPNPSLQFIVKIFNLSVLAAVGEKLFFSPVPEPALGNPPEV